MSAAIVRSQRGGAVLKLVLALVILGLLAAGYTWAVLSWSYSKGERAGWVQKLSHKGYVCKTWEGELSMIAMPGAAPEKFLFTVHDEAVAAEINRNMGKRVSLHYEEHIGIPTTCFGETGYYVTRITVVDQITPGGLVPQPPPPAAPSGGAAGAN